ncbi:MAG: 50S ribosomal protein L30 [Armatimonadetes bacterium]|nr:50S ribosomal protein L30 [Anaerolineae bacterium]
MADLKFLKITLVRSPIGYQKYQGITAKSLGLRRLNYTVFQKGTPQIVGMCKQIEHLLLVEEVTEAEAAPHLAARAAKRAAEYVWVADDDGAEPVAPTPVKAAATPRKVVADEVKAAGDDLTKIEGIGPKMSAALNAAGIHTFDQLANTGEEQLRDAIQAAGMKLAPGVSSWAEQAQLAAQADWDALEKLQSRLVGGRKLD